MRSAVPSVAVAALAACLGVSAAEPKIRLEFRRAETEAAKGLDEATVPGSKTKIYLHKTAELDADDIAEATLDDATLKVKFTKEGAAKMAKLSKEHTGKPLAVLLDGKVLIAPTIRDPIGGEAALTGFAKEDLERIVKALKAK
jgi:preprotein translocase subunit SecD